MTEAGAQPVEIREFARTVVASPSLAEKLAPPGGPLTDDDPGAPIVLTAPGRPDALRIVEGRKARVPGLEGMPDPHQRERIVHGMANHELQAAELFAWALLAFPDAPPEFRQGVAGILIEEQRHTRMYIARLRAYGVEFGDHPVSGYFWNKAEHLTSPVRFLCAMSLTWENANLDHSIDYAAAARKAGDEPLAAVFDQIHRDEIGHVHFGWKWLGHWKVPAQSMWEAYCEHLTWPLRPAKARGAAFHWRGREAAGLDPEFIRLLEASEGS